MISDYFVIAITNMNKRKLRSFLTLLGVLISITTIFVLISVSLGLQVAVKEQFRLLGTDKFFIQPRGQLAGPGTAAAVMLTQEDVDAIEKISGVREISTWTVASAKIEFNDEIRFTNVIGIDLDTSNLFIETGAYEAEDGRVLEKGDTFAIMIGSQYTHNEFFSGSVKVGDTILVNDVSFEVQGILKSLGNPEDDRLIYMPYSQFRGLFDIPQRIDAIVVQVNEQEMVKAIAGRAERKLIKSRDLTKETKDFTILTPEELLASFGTILTIITAFLTSIAGVSLVVGGIGIANTVYTSVLERTKQIGILKAIGAQNKDILFIFLIESGLLGLTGGIIGVIIGIGISEIIEYIAIHQLGTTLLRAVIPPLLILGSLAFSFLVGAISGLWPAWRATKIRPVEALRYE